MRLFFELARRSFQRHMTYRAAAIAGLVTNFFFGLLRFAILIALYDGASEVEGYTVDGVLTYTALTQAMIAYLMMFGWWDLMTSIHNGDIAVDLLKPMHLFRYLLAQDAGRAISALLLRGISVLMLYELFYDLSYPSLGWQTVALIISLILSWFVSFAFRFLVNLAAFWTPNAVGIGRFAFFGSLFFSGFFMPLRFFPEIIQRIAYATPFPYLLDTVVQIYLGIPTNAEIGRILALQLFWAVGLVLLAQLILRRGVRRLVILGG